MKKFAAVFVALLLSGCGEESATRAIAAHGFKQIRLTGAVWFGCAESDDFFYNSKFEAVGVNSQPVSGMVCGGPLKGWTVRIN